MTTVLAMQVGWRREYDKFLLRMALLVQSVFAYAAGNAALLQSVCENNVQVVLCFLHCLRVRLSKASVATRH